MSSLTLHTDCYLQFSYLVFQMELTLRLEREQLHQVPKKNRNLGDSLYSNMVKELPDI